MNIHKTLYTYLIYLSFILEVLIYLGIFDLGPQYMKTTMTIIKLYISGYLIYKLNPLTRGVVQFDEFEKNLIFSCAIYLLLSTSIAQYLSSTI
jgi:hypothetical protein